MYLAPLNYDRFFKKVFSDIDIAKKFLEDFLGVKIEHIEKLDSKHRITDDSRIVEFDFRCKIEGQYVIIDMQQWFKPDIAQRFYLYHAVNTSLQLETLPKKAIVEPDDKKKPKAFDDYRSIEPVITLVWMVSDNLGFVDNSISYIMTPEAISEFIKNQTLWKNEDIEKIIVERERLLKLLHNKTREVDFIGKSKLIFAFQKNIVKSKKIESYAEWFGFAEKTLNKENTEEDFAEYKEDATFKRVIKKLKCGELSQEDVNYIGSEEEIWEMVEKFERDNFDMGMIEGEKKKAIEIAIKLLKNKVPIDVIVISTGLRREEIEAF